jgi:hypothetical protein
VAGRRSLKPHPAAPTYARRLFICRAVVI